MAIELLSWAIWPTRMLGIGLTEASLFSWLLLFALNAMLFGAFGFLIGCAAVRWKRGLVGIYCLFTTLLILWCFWLLGFSLLQYSLATIVLIVIFYAVPFAAMFTSMRTQP